MKLAACSVALCAFAAASIASMTAVEAAPGGPVKISAKLKTVEIKDEALGIVAFRMQIPEDWSFEGALLRDPYCGTIPTVVYRATSPDGRVGYQTLPQFSWVSSDDPSFIAAYRKFHCKTMRPMTPTEFLTYILPAIRPDAVAGPIGPTADAKQLDDMIAQFNQRSAGMGGSETGGGVRTVVTYTFHGEPMEENIRVVVANFTHRLLGRHTWSQSTGDVIGLRAPKGQLQAVMTAMGPYIGGGQLTQEWMQRLSRKLADDNARAMAAIKRQGDETRAMLDRNHKANMAASQQRFDKSQAIEREREDARHRSAVAWTLYAGDEQLVGNPRTGQVSRVGTAGGTHGYQDNVSGDIVMSNDPNFDPSYYVRGTWTQLENINPLQP